MPDLGPLGPPAFAERDLQRRAMTLWGVAATVVVMGVVWTAVTWANGWGLSRITVTSTVMLTGLAGMALARRGHARVGAWTILGIGSLAVTLHLVLGGPELAPTVGGYYVLVVAAGVLVGGGAAIAMAVFGVLVLAWFASWDGISMLATVGSGQTEWDIARANSVALVALGLLLAFSARRINEAFATADANAAALAEANAALRDSQDQVLRAQKLETVGAISGAVAHDFNNDLTVIDGYAGLIRSGDGSSADHEVWAGEIVKAAERSARLTRQLLALGRQQVFEPRPVELDGVLRDQRRMLQKILGADRRLLVTEGAAGAVVVVDPAQVEQVLINLTLNARDAMEPGGTLELRTRTLDVDAAAVVQGSHLRPGAAVEVAVSDTGSGMDSDTLARACEPFFSTKGLARGTGLGLSSVQAIMHRSGGDLRIDSEPGVGTTVHCLFPRSDATAEASAPVPATAERLDGVRILLVEDDAMVRGLTERLLRHAGASVDVHGDPVAVATRAEELVDGIDLLVSDVVMPGLNGADLADLLHHRRPDLPVLFISGYLEGSMVEQGLLDPGVELLQKPFTETQLVARVHRIARGGVQGGRAAG